MSKFLKIRVEKKEENYTLRGCSLFVSGLKVKTKRRWHPRNVWFSFFFNAYVKKLLASIYRSSNLFVTEFEIRIVNYGPRF